jgi:hypothetical protein
MAQLDKTFPTGDCSMCILSPKLIECQRHPDIYILAQIDAAYSVPLKGAEPKILAFLCNWCGYAGADLAGVSRIQYAPNIRVIRVMCSARVHSDFVLRGFSNGADGVLVVGCCVEDCHYISGIHEAARMVGRAKRI